MLQAIYIYIFLILITHSHTKLNQNIGLNHVSGSARREVSSKFVNSFRIFNILPASAVEAALLKVVCRGLEAADEFCTLAEWPPLPPPLPGERRLWCLVAPLVQKVYINYSRWIKKYVLFLQIFCIMWDINGCHTHFRTCIFLVTFNTLKHGVNKGTQFEVIQHTNVYVKHIIIF